MATARNANKLRLLCYNLDGLDDEDIVPRTEGACRVLLHENPEVILLQEVVTESLPILRARCMPDYDIHLGLEGKRRGPTSYFTAILVRKDCSSVERATIIPFPTTRQSRTLLEVECQIKSVPVTLLTSHLESLRECSSERKNQLSQAFSRMKSADIKRVVLFGGDLNLRDYELSDIAAIPEDVVDIWEYTGKDPRTEFTWDLRINDNKQIDTRYQPRCRFDRIYMRNSDPPLLSPVKFELTGNWRLRTCGRFPSDHWGILCHFDILNKEPENSKE
ncbi:tyrosyl-DNA phosphodiesterase 2-like isoform X2 [Biomphalaria glabrata]|uniref:Tyrosyl-DNA phosphodiesterase 2 n=1 Tax=Biomphalaria glabrata TaxID=6526 RepID=A0A9W3AVG7_BIOGL|nr:tyrosyl-DNA phosphodiesterase 2-like isoform X2 [Biomphalaria glabrata]